MASNTPAQGSVNASGGHARVPDPQQAKAQASARLQMFHSDRALDMFQCDRVGSIEAQQRRTQGVAAGVARVNHGFPGGVGGVAGGVASSVGSGPPAPGQPIRDATDLRGVGTQFSS